MEICDLDRSIEIRSLSVRDWGNLDFVYLTFFWFYEFLYFLEYGCHKIHTSCMVRFLSILRLYGWWTLLDYKGYGFSASFSLFLVWNCWYWLLNFGATVGRVWFLQKLVRQCCLWKNKLFSFDVLIGWFWRANTIGIYHLLECEKPFMKKRL